MEGFYAGWHIQAGVPAGSGNRCDIAARQEGEQEGPRQGCQEVNNFK